MDSQPLRTSVIGSYPQPGWLEHAASNLSQFGPDDVAEAQDDAVRAALHDQIASGVDVVTDGEQTRLDFNLSFYGFLRGIEPEGAAPRRFGPPAHDQRGRHRVVGTLMAPNGLGVVAEFRRLERLIAPWLLGRDHPPALKVSTPGPYTLAGRLIPGAPGPYRDRWEVSEALLPIVQAELAALADAGCREVCVDEPSMSCYAHREDAQRLAALFNRTVARVRGRMRVCVHLCFGNFKGRAVGPRQLAPLFPAFLDLDCDEMHVEMASREFAELDCIAAIARKRDVAVGIVDVKSYYIETPDDIARRVRRCLEFVPPERLVLAPDCGLSQTARWAARSKLESLAQGVRAVRRSLGLPNA